MSLTHLLAPVAHTPAGRRRRVVVDARRSACRWVGVAVALVVLEVALLRQPALALVALIPLALAWDTWRMRLPTLTARTLTRADLASLPTILQQAANMPSNLPKRQRADEWSPIRSKAPRYQHPLL